MGLYVLHELNTQHIQKLNRFETRLKQSFIVVDWLDDATPLICSRDIALLRSLASVTTVSL